MKKKMSITIDDYYAGILYAILDEYLNRIDREIEELDGNLVATDLLKTRMGEAMEILKAVEKIQPAYPKVEANR